MRIGIKQNLSETGFYETELGTSQNSKTINKWNSDDNNKPSAAQRMSVSKIFVWCNNRILQLIQTKIIQNNIYI